MHKNYYVGLPHAAWPLSLSTYPHLTRDAGISNGAPIIRGTRTTVRAVAEVHQRVGMSADDIWMALPYSPRGRGPSRARDAFDHPSEIDAENDFEALREMSGGHLWRFERAAPPAVER